jgi:hypothetical protein
LTSLRAIKNLKNLWAVPESKRTEEPEASKAVLFGFYFTLKKRIRDERIF